MGPRRNNFPFWRPALAVWVATVSGTAAQATGGLAEFLRLAMERSPELAKIEQAYRAARAAADLERSALGPRLDWSATGPSYATLERRQTLFEGADYVRTESTVLGYGSALSYHQRTPWGGALRMGGGWIQTDLDQTTTLPADLAIGDEFDRNFEVDTRNLDGNVRVTIQQPLFAGNEYRLRRSRARVLEREAELSLDLQRGRAQLRLAADYLSYQTRHAELAGRTLRRDLAESRLAAIENEVRNGGAALLEAQQARLALGREEVKVRKALANLKEAEDVLRVALSVPAGLPLPIAPDTIPAIQTDPPAIAAGDGDSGRRPDLALLQERIEAQRLNEEETVERLGFKLEMIGSLAFTGFGADLDAATESWGLNEIELGIGATFPIFDGGLRHATLDGLRAERASREIELDLARRKATMEIPAFRRKLETSLALLELSAGNLTLAEQNARIAREQAAEGFMPADELHEFELGVVDLRAEAVAARARATLASLELQHALGRSPLEVLR